MNLKQITFEQVFYLTAFLLGIAIRFANLGAAPLSDSEADLALQALALAKSGSLTAQALSPEPGYLVMTSWLFNMFGSSNFLARFWPAAAGSLLVLLPWLIVRRVQPGLLERKAAIFMAFGLALTPGLVAASRQVGGTMMAVSFLLLTAAAYLAGSGKNWAIAAGILGGLALLSGPAVIPGLITLTAVGMMAWRYYHFHPPSRPMFLAIAATILLVGSNFFRDPAGLAAWLDTLPVYLQGWFLPTAPFVGVPALRLAAALVIYQPVAVVFGLVSAGRSLFLPAEGEDRLGIRLILGGLVIVFVLVLAYPSRQATDLAWILVPLWLVAAREIRRYLPTAGEDQQAAANNVVSILQALVLILLFGLLWYTLASASRIQLGDTGRLMRYVVILGILALGALITVLIQLGWSWTTARNGLAWGVFGGLALFAISALWSTAYLRKNLPQELWTRSPGSGNTALFTKTLMELSQRNTGRPDSIDIVSEVSEASMRWALRKFSNTEFVDQYSAKTLPSILITRQTQETPALLAAYRGQDFVWWQYPGWSGPLPQDLPGWLTFRSGPIQQESVILWARSDRFPGGILSPLEIGGDSSSQPPFDEQSDTSSDQIQK